MALEFKYARLSLAPSEIEDCVSLERGVTKVVKVHVIVRRLVIVARVGGGVIGMHLIAKIEVQARGHYLAVEHGFLDVHHGPKIGQKRRKVFLGETRRSEPPHIFRVEFFKGAEIGTMPPR